MIREEMKKALPALKAYADGMIIQLRKKGTVKWVDFLEDDIVVSQYYEYRIKPESQYRPFKSQEECWNEMLKYHPFGWVLSDGVYRSIQSVYNNVIYSNEYYQGIDFEKALEELTFIDTTPFGIKEEQTMITSEYTRLEAHIAVLEDIAEEYPGKTIENVIAQLEARKKEVENAH